MKAVKYMDENTLIKKSIEVLMEKLGPVETIRFVNLSRKKRMESVRRHREWQKCWIKINSLMKFLENKIYRNNKYSDVIKKLLLEKIESLYRDSCFL